MAKTIYKNNKPYKHISNSGKVTFLKGEKDPLSKSSSKSSSSSSRPITNITATLSTDGRTETIKTTTNGRTQTTVTRKSSGGRSSSRTVSGNITQAQQRQITAELAKTEEAKQKSLEQRKVELAKLEKEKGLQAQIKTKDGVIIQEGRFKLNKSAQNEIIRRTKNIRREELRNKKREPATVPFLFA